MGSEYNRNSPSASLLNVGHLGNTPSYSGGSQTGSEYNFGSTNSPSLDSMLQSTSGGHSHRFTTSTLPDHRSNLPMHNYGGAYDSSLYTNAPGTAGNIPQHQSPTGGHRHRLSIGSNGQYDGSDTTSQRGQATFTAEGYGDNAIVNNGNEPMSAQGQDDETGKGDDSQAAPAWSELKTKAGKERKRLPLACIACRRKKIRCSGEKPACKHCLRSRIPCVYKVTTRKAAPRTDYMAMLDKRLKRMEDRVIRVIPKEDQGVVSNTGRSNVKPPIPPAPPKTGAGTKKRGAEQAFDEELNDWANTKVGDPEKKNAGLEGSTADVPEGVDADEHSLLREGADQLPEKDLQQHLAEVFFDYVYGQSYHLLHKPSFMRRLAQDQVPPVLMLAVCAMSARFSNHPSIRTEPAFLRGEQWAKPAREISLRRYDQPNITILIVYLILGLHEFGTCQGGRSWMFGGMAQRMAYALQLHQDLDHDPKRSTGNDKSELTFTDREIRRRTMWSCFLLDRFSSSGTDRPTFVGPEYIRAQLPIREKLFTMEITGPTEDLKGNIPNPVGEETGQVADARQNMGVAAYTIRLVALWGDLINYMNLGGKEREQKPMWDDESTFQELRRAADHWKDTLPEALEYTPENLASHASGKVANQFLFMHIVFNQIMLFMHRFALPSPGQRAVYPKEMPEEFLSDASKTALEAAKNISALVHEGMDHTVVAPFAGYAAFFSSTVHIHGAFSQNPALEASSKQNLAWNVKYLTKMKKHWGMFHFVTENLRDLYRKHADAAKSGAFGKMSKDGEGIFQYGDWFDRYPHGVSGTDFDEPQADVKKDPGADAVLGQQSDLQTVEEFFSKLSPPSRNTANPQSQQKSRKSRKKQESKTDVKAAATSNTQQQGGDGAGSNQQQQHPTQSQQQMPQSLPQQQQQHVQSLQGNAMDQQQFTQSYNVGQHSSAFPPGFQQPPNALLMHHNNGVMSQLDRQMVLSSYAGGEQNPAALAQHNLGANSNPMMDGGVNMGDFGGNFNPVASAAGGANSGFWGDPSSAWFMPFNMDPPTMADDNNLLTTGGFDWPNTFPDFGSLPPTGMTPTPVMDMDTGQDGQGGGMDSMR